MTGLYSVPVLKDHHPYRLFGLVANSKYCEGRPSVLRMRDPPGRRGFLRE